MTGDLVMLSDSTRLTSFILWCLNASSALYQPCLEFNAVVDQRNIETGNTFVSQPRDNSKIEALISEIIHFRLLIQVVSSLPGLVYPSATGAFPADSPACGFFGELCVPGTLTFLKRKSIISLDLISVARVCSGQNSTLVIEIVVPLVVVFILLCSAGAYSV